MIKKLNFIDKILIKFFNFIYKIQEEKHNKKMAKLKLKLSKKVISGNVAGEKFCQNSCATLTIKNKDEEKKVNIEKLEKIILQSINEPQKLFSYIKGSKTKVYHNIFADKILKVIKEDEGFIYPKTGFKALYLNLIFNKKTSLNSPEMFILRNLDVNVYAFIYQFYNWYCFKMKLDGFEAQTQEQFKHVFEICETSKINDLSLDEILSLKSAIKRDKEAIDFVLNFTKKYSMAKKSLKKIKQGQKVSI